MLNFIDRRWWLGEETYMYNYMISRTLAIHGEEQEE